MQCSNHTGFSCFDRIILIVNWTCGTSEIINLIALHMNILQNILTNKFKIGIIHQMADVVFLSCEQIVHTYYIISLFQQLFTQMGSNKSCSPCHKYSISFHLRILHLISLRSLVSRPYRLHWNCRPTLFAGNVHYLCTISRSMDLS